MDPEAKQLFKSGCLAGLFLFAGLLVGCWLVLIEFGAAFHETARDRVDRTIAWIVLIGLLAAFLATCLKAKGQRRPMKQASSSTNPDLAGTPWAQDPDFTYDPSPQSGPQVNAEQEGASDGEKTLD